MDIFCKTCGQDILEENGYPVCICSKQEDLNSFKVLPNWSPKHQSFDLGAVYDLPRNVFCLNKSSNYVVVIEKDFSIVGFNLGDGKASY